VIDDDLADAPGERAELLHLVAIVASDLALHERPEIDGRRGTIGEADEATRRRIDPQRSHNQSRRGPARPDSDLSRADERVVREANVDRIADRNDFAVGPASVDARSVVEPPEVCASPVATAGRGG
jgi:hypothetical protein